MNTRVPRAAQRTVALLCAFRTVTISFLCLAPAWPLLANPDPNLGLTIARAQRPNGPVAVLTWTSVAGAHYKVQYSATLIPPAPWQDFEVVTAASATSFLRSAARAPRVGHA